MGLFFKTLTLLVVPALAVLAWAYSRLDADWVTYYMPDPPGSAFESKVGMTEPGRGPS